VIQQNKHIFRGTLFTKKDRTYSQILTVTKDKTTKLRVGLDKNETLKTTTKLQGLAKLDFQRLDFQISIKRVTSNTVLLVYCAW